MIMEWWLIEASRCFFSYTYVTNFFGDNVSRPSACLLYVINKSPRNINWGWNQISLWRIKINLFQKCTWCVMHAILHGASTINNWCSFSLLPFRKKNNMRCHYGRTNAAVWDVYQSTMSPGWCDFDFKCITFKCVVVILFMSLPSAIQFRSMAQVPMINKKTGHVMDWCHRI